jgi:hypothetical protein
MKLKIYITLCLFSFLSTHVYGITYYLDSMNGSDKNNGVSLKSPWATLSKIKNINLKAGDQILLKYGSIFKGKINISNTIATKNSPIVVSTYDDNKLKDNILPKIDGAGFLGTIEIINSKWIEIRNLELTSDGGKAVDEKAKIDRYGVYVSKSQNVIIDNLIIHNIYSTIATKSEGKNNKTAYGHGVRVEHSDTLKVSNCNIKRVGRYGINTKRSSNIEVFNNHTDHTGCSGIQLGTTTNAIIKGNIFNHPGSFVDKRMHGRGSGSWVWSCENIIYENNQFLNAKGKADSCGVHIDFNCKNIIIQHNLSVNNEGGFVEILGNNYNCAYRYNISINDGSRRKGQDGAHQEGKVLWLSGYAGRKQSRKGPFNSYIYNNTVFVKKGIKPGIAISPTTKGALIANNIFYIMENTRTVKGDQKIYKKTKAKSSNVVFKNNIYAHKNILPTNLGLHDSSIIIGDPLFKNPGDLMPKSYTPTNLKIVRNKSITISKIPGDKIGIKIGFEVKKDFFGNPITGIPDIGAIELKR